MKIAVIGTGYVGLVAGTCLADMGNQVICVDNDKEKIKQLNNAKIPIYEPGLEELIKTNLDEKRLSFSENIELAIKESSVCFIAVGTPMEENGSANLKYVFQVAEDIAKNMNEYKVIVNKSTVPIGTAQKIKETIKSITKFPFDIVSNPEFLKQGNAVFDFLSPDRIIIGTETEKSKKIMEEVYSSFLKTSNRIIFTDIKSAEMIKYASNSFLATKISFMNEMANLCEKVGADIEMVRIGMSTDTRIGNKFLFPGVGYGGSCFPKDVKALINTGEENGIEMSIIKAVDKVNTNQKLAFTQKVLDHFNNDVKNKTIAIWGLAFKPKTNDMREAPAITIINKLLQQGAIITAFDPKAIESAKYIWGDKIEYTQNSYDALEKADALLLLTEWNEFRNPDFEKLKSLMKSPVIFDGRNQYNKQDLINLGIKYYCIGK